MVRGSVLILLPGNTIFGQERALINLAILLRSIGVESHFLIHANWGSAIRKYLEDLSFAFTALPFGTIWSPGLLLKNPRAIVGNVLAIENVTREFAELLSASKFDAIVLGNPTFAVYLLPVLRRHRIYTVFRHGDVPPDSNFLVRALTRAVFRRADTHVANCRFVAKALSEFGLPTKPRVIYNQPIPSTGRDSILRFEREKRLIYVGQLSPHKGIDVALAAFDALASTDEMISLDIVGAPPGVKQGRSLQVVDKLISSQRRWGNRIRNHGFLADPSPLMQRASVHLCPSRWPDPSPNVIFEAKRESVPTVAFASGGIPELIEHRHDGFLCATANVEGLMEGIRYFLKDETVRAEAGKRARESLESKFPYAAYAESWKTVLRLH